MANQIILSYTSAEWDVINEHIGNNGLPSFLNRKIQSLQSKENICTACLEDGCELIKKVPRLSEKSMEVLYNVQMKTGKPLSTIVSRLIIDPLLYK